MKKGLLQNLLIAAAIVIVGALSYYYAAHSNNSKSVSPLKDEIILLYTNDVHCCVDKNIGYAGLSAYKKSMKQAGKNVVLIDCGDSIQGEYIGTISKGDYIVDIMNKTGYDLAICGNHEFDYGMDALKNVINKSKAKYLNSNITYTGNGENALAQTASYTILNFGETKVGFIGVTTPATTNTSTPGCFQENMKFVYDFKSHNNGKDLFNTVQSAVDACLKDGAHYVVAITHLGVGNGYEPFTSTNMIRNTRGIDAVLDGHSHSTVPYMVIQNKEGKNVVLTSSGEKLRSIGQMTISPEGINSELLTTFGGKDQGLAEFINGIKTAYDLELRKVIGTSDTLLSCFNERYVRIIRNRETNLGDFVTDALLAATDGDIAVFNGGSIRADLPKGEVTIGTLNSINGFNNMICKTRVTGQVILDMLEMSYRKTMPMITNDGKWSIGENGGFLQVSGIKCTIDTSVPSSVIVDDNGMFIKVGEWRRVHDVMVKNSEGNYEPIDPLKTYTVVSTDYLIKESGDGITQLTGRELLLDDTISVTQALIDYFKSFNGNLSRYAQPDGRIVIK